MRDAVFESLMNCRFCNFHILHFRNGEIPVQWQVLRSACTLGGWVFEEFHGIIPMERRTWDAERIGVTIIIDGAVDCFLMIDRV
jgi:hypothetical protein